MSKTGQDQYDVQRAIDALCARSRQALNARVKCLDATQAAALGYPVHKDFGVEVVKVRIGASAEASRARGRARVISNQKIKASGVIGGVL